MVVLMDIQDGTRKISRQGINLSVGKPNHCPVATRTALVKAADSRTSPVSQVVLDIAGQGMRYIPGDRLGVLPQNSAALVDRTLAALRARDEASVRLTSAWRDALAPILGESPVAVPLRTFLAYAKLRPLGRADFRDAGRPKRPSG
jgi:sulfite reductase alpha subunit-like flavoprotein